MTLPAKQPDPAEGSGDAQRPDWLRGTDEDLGVMPTSRAPVRKPSSKPSAAPERIEGLVGPETPAQAPPPILEERGIQLGVDAQSAAPSTLSKLFEAIRGGNAQAPPAMAGTIETWSLALSAVFLPSRKRMSSSLT